MKMLSNVLPKSLLALLYSLLMSACAMKDVEHNLSPIGTQEEDTAIILSSPTVAVLAIDGEELGMTMVGQSKRFILGAGEHQVLVRYQDLWHLSDDQHEIVRSEPVLLAFAVEAGKKYTFSHKAIDGMAQAETFAERPMIRVISDAKPVAAKAKIVPGKSLVQRVLSTTTPSRAVSVTPTPVASIESAVANAPSAPKVSDSVKPAVTATQDKSDSESFTVRAEAVPEPAAKSAQAMELDMLKYWWQQSSVEQRAAFLQWQRATAANNPNPL